ncbi:hypothetical protein [Pantoea sp. 18069]|uniref:hypothetical protein n=1 Tax=Pantoea sp. 18069 TaxID=2681415 RepID=UPI00135C2A38|nr:hypothetical protein [Pantoea sp. 18069]
MIDGELLQGRTLTSWPSLKADRSGWMSRGRRSTADQPPQAGRHSRVQRAFPESAWQGGLIRRWAKAGLVAHWLKIDATGGERLERWLQEQPDLTLQELAQKLQAVRL